MAFAIAVGTGHSRLASDQGKWSGREREIVTTRPLGDGPKKEVREINV
jgi:hypothetical protein